MTDFTPEQRRAMRGERFDCTCGYDGPQWEGATTCAHCGGRLAAFTPCEYFAACHRAAEGTVSHPVLGAVPSCRRCADAVGATLSPSTDQFFAEMRAAREVPAFTTDRRDTT